MLKLLSLVMAAIVWGLLSLTLPHEIFPGPIETARTLWGDIAGGECGTDLAMTLLRVVAGLLLALILGVPVGVLMGLNRRAEAVLDVWVMIGLTVPSLCYAIMAFMWFGLNEGAAIIAIAVTAAPSITINIWEGVKNVDTRLIAMARVFEASRPAIVRRVLLPQIFPYIMASARLRARHYLEDHGSGGTDRPSERRRVQAVLLVSACRYAPSPCLDAPLHHHHAPHRASDLETDRTASLRMASTGSDMNSVIEVTSLRKTFKGRDGTSRAVLKDLDLAVGAGEFLCILGPSGCGKSTLLNVLAGLDKVYEGRASVSGGRVGYLFQEPRLLPWLTADGNLDFALASCRVPTSRWSELKSRYLAMTGLSKYCDYYPHQISGGMAQRLALVRALCVEPGILLMDEPFSGLDEITARRIRSDLLSIWKETRKTIVFVTHNAYEACFLADRILVMSNGAFRQEMRVPIAAAAKL